MEEKEEEEQMLFVFPSKEHHENTFKRTFTGRWDLFVLEWQICLWLQGS